MRLRKERGRTTQFCSGRLLLLLFFKKRRFFSLGSVTAPSLLLLLPVPPPFFPSVSLFPIVSGLPLLAFCSLSPLLHSHSLLFSFLLSPFSSFSSSVLISADEYKQLISPLPFPLSSPLRMRKKKMTLLSSSSFPYLFLSLSHLPIFLSLSAIVLACTNPRKIVAAATSREKCEHYFWHRVLPAFFY